MKRLIILLIATFIIGCSNNFHQVKMPNGTYEEWRGKNYRCYIKIIEGKVKSFRHTAIGNNLYMNVYFYPDTLKGKWSCDLTNYPIACLDIISRKEFTLEQVKGFVEEMLTDPKWPLEFSRDEVRFNIKDFDRETLKDCYIRFIEAEVFKWCYYWPEIKYYGKLDFDYTELYVKEKNKWEKVYCR